MTLDAATLADLKKALTQIDAKSAVAIVLEVFGPEIQQLRERVTQLEADLAERVHKGVWDANFTYRKHNTVTFGGCQWTAISNDNLGAPGRSAGWLLTVKRGRDGKDAP
jgi:hypothetical protein